MSVIVNSKYSKDFVSDRITLKKYDELYDQAVAILNYKNKISKEVSDNLMTYLNMSGFEFSKQLRNKYRGEISCYNECEALTDVYNCYQNKVNAIISKIKFTKREFISFELYKKDLPKKNEKKGDLKSVKYKTSNDDLSLTLTYLARYGNENTVKYITEIGYPKAVENDDKDKQKYYNIILDTINRRGFDGLYSLALSRRHRILSKYTGKAIEFKSLNFRGLTSRIKTIVDYNSNKKSNISAFVTINVADKGLVDIPVKISNTYHGKLSEYVKNPDKSMSYMYLVKFNKKQEVILLLVKDGVRVYPDNSVDNVVGIDVNVKHNLFSLSNGDFYDFDRKLLREYLHELDKVDKLKSKNEEYKIGKRRLIKLDHYKNSIKHSTLRLIVNICKDLQSKGITHIVLENLDNSFGRSKAKNKDLENQKYNRINHILQLGSLKNEFKHIALNYGICVSFILAEYTSQMCPVCGCIHVENRPDQETFECIECGHKANADFNAAVNIKNRVDQAVLRKTLLKTSTDGSYIPKKINHEDLKKKILKCVMQLNKIRK